MRDETSPAPLSWRFARLPRPGGAWLRVGHGPRPEGPVRGTLLLLPGRCEAIEKYGEVAQLAAGWGLHTAALDWRGQGGSARFLANSHRGHVDRFETFLDDMDAALPELLRDQPGPVLALGHSMGGHLLLRFAAERSHPFTALVLSAPMLGVHLPLPEALALRLAVAMVRRGRGEAYAWAQRDWGPQDAVFAGNRLTSDPVRFQTQIRLFTERPELALGGVTWGWLAAALLSIRTLLAPSALDKVDLPVLLLSGLNDRIVRLDRHDWLAGRLADCRHRRYAGARHELLMEADPIRDRVLADIKEFLRRQMPAAPEPRNADLMNGKGNDMNRTTGSAMLGAALSMLVGSAALAATAADFRQSAFPPPPSAKQQPTSLEKHGDVRIDPYDWLRDRDYPKVDDAAVLEHLKAENAYVDKVLGDAESPLRATLFQEMKGRIKEDDSGVPYREGAYEYQVRYEAGKQYPIYVRRSVGGGDFTTILDVNALAEGKGYMRVSSVSPSPDGRYLAYTEDDDGSELLKVRVKDLTTGKIIGGEITGAGYGVAWANDNKTLFYTLRDEYQRPKKVMRHVLGNDPKADALVYEEKDGPWTVGVGRSLSGRLIIIGAENNASNEVRLLPADQPTGEPRVLVPRQTFRETQVADQGDTLWILTNDTHRNFRLVKAPARDPSPANWTEVIAGSDDVYLTEVEAFRDWLVIFDRKDGQQRVRVRNAQGQEHLVAFPDSSFYVTATDNADYEARTLRLTYESLVTPRTVYDYDLTARTLATRKVQEIPSGYDASQYVTERLMAPSRDGKTKIPVSIVYKKGFEKDGKRPVLLYGYGSYGIPTFPRFNTNRISLLDRGFAYAIAQIRGGDEMGRGWYEDGKLEHKTNTFFDFIDAAEFLVAQGYAGKGTVSIQGGSAGGLLVGATLNLAPEGLFRAAVAQVPFVDVVSTMLDETLPLTAGEYDEWGNPNEKAAYLRMKGYSPYDNVTARPYPHIMITAGLSDPRVTYWEPAKWAAKLRAMKTGDSVLLSYTNMGAGHGGAAGRYDALKETAMVYAFLLKAYGIEK